MSTDTVVLIHGLWMTPLSWEHWVEHFSARGMNVVARPWPGHEGDPEQIRRDPTAMVNVGIGEVVDHYERIIRAMDNPPIIMGHSTGGLVTQILLDHGLGSAGVAIDPAPGKGIFVLPWSTLKGSFPVLKNPANNHKAVALSSEEFHYAFTNTLTPAESQRIYERYAVPAPGRTLFQAALANLNPNSPARIDYKNDSRAPLLIIGGGEDHLCPPRVTRTNAKLQHKSKAITAYREFPGRSHYTLGQTGWEEVADFALDWALHPRELDQVS